MFNPFAQYSVMRGSGMSILFSIFAVIFFIVTMPYLAYAQWRHGRLTDEQKGYKTWDELKANCDEHGIVRMKK